MRKVLSVITVLLLTIAASLAVAQSPATAPANLQGGEVVELELRGGETHTYRLELKKDQFYKVDPQRPYAHPYYWAPFILIGNWK